ncbi:MAG: chromosome partitioning protein ParB [Gammaproteobacteria bacterium]|nr:chromosome partitioning protein ParB [Gammaproteobacteria bacterium]
MNSHQHLIEVDIASLRPTQVTVGIAEVAKKRAEWHALGKKDRNKRLKQQWFPSVLGPKGRYYITDHHHLGLALLEEGIASAWVTVQRDYSWLDPDRFWRVMDFHQLTHPYDENGNRLEYSAIPKDITQLRNDPYRSLAGFVRVAGGYAKDSAPFTEFLWADFFRPQISVDLINQSPKQAVEQAVGLARGSEARYLPGWTGVPLSPPTKG